MTSKLPCPWFLLAANSAVPFSCPVCAVEVAPDLPAVEVTIVSHRVLQPLIQLD